MSNSIEIIVKKTDKKIESVIKPVNKNFETTLKRGDVRGIQGKSAYQIALDNGFVGTEEEWLASLVGTGDKTFVYSHNIPASTWNVTHNLDKFPSVSVVDSANSLVEGKVFYADLNSVVLEFNGAFTGKAYFN